MLRSVDPVDGQIVDPLHLQPLENSLQLAFPLLERHPGKQFARDHPVTGGSMRAVLQGLAQETLRRGRRPALFPGG